MRSECLIRAELPAAFGRAVIAIEVNGRAGSTWLTYEASHGRDEWLVEWLLADETHRNQKAVTSPSRQDRQFGPQKDRRGGAFTG